MKAPPAEADETGMTTFVEKESEDDGSPPGRGRNRGGGRPSGGTSGSSRPGTRPASTPTRAGPAPSLRSTFRTASAGPRPTTGSPSTTASATSAGTTRSTWSGTQSSRSGGRPPTPQRAKADALHLRPVAAFRRAKEEAAGRGGAFQDPHQEKGAALEDEVAAIAEEADAAEKACKSLQGAQARPTTARVALAVAPDGPGPPPAGGSGTRQPLPDPRQMDCRALAGRRNPAAGHRPIHAATSILRPVDAQIDPNTHKNRKRWGLMPTCRLGGHGLRPGSQ